MGLKLPDLTLSHWNKMIEGLQQSSDELYKQTAANLETHHLKGIGLERATMTEGGLLSANREYLQIRNKDLLFHVCCAASGNGTFVSTWLGQGEWGFWAFLAIVPIIGFVVRSARGARTPRIPPPRGRTHPAEDPR